jgi:hypothetical protein
MPPDYTPLLEDYNEGRRPVQDVLQACRSFQGPQPHFLCDYAVWCLGHLSEPKLFVLLRSLIDDDPATPAITFNGATLISVALSTP